MIYDSESQLQIFILCGNTPIFYNIFGMELSLPISTPEILSSLSQLSAADTAWKSLALEPQQSLCVSAGNHERLLDWTMETMEVMGSSKSTKYFAKTYIDRFLSSRDSVPENELQLYAVAAINIAVKTNEQQPLSFSNFWSGLYQEDQIAEAETALQLSPNFRLKFTTPYCYIKILREVLPAAYDTVLTQLQPILDYCCVLSEFVGVAASQLLCAALHFVLKSTTKRVDANPVLAIWTQWPTINQLSARIEHILSQDLSQLAD